MCGPGHGPLSRHSGACFVGPKNIVRGMVWRSGGHERPVPYGPIQKAIRAAHARYDLTAAIDERYADQMMSELAAEGVAVESFPQSNERMCPAAADLRSAVLAGDLAHDGDPILSAHVNAAASRDIGDGGFKLVKSRKNGPPIDGAVALAMANVLHNRKPVETQGLFALCDFV